MGRTRAWSTLAIVLIGGSVALAPVGAASASTHKTTHHKTKKKKKSTHSSSSGSNVGSLGCPKQSLISTATAVTYTGPSAQNGGTAACIYADAAGDNLNVVFDMPNQTRSHFVASDPADIGQPATAVSGIGSAAFSTTTYGHAEIDVYQSSTKGFAITLDPANGGTVTPADLTQVIAVARAIAAEKIS